MTIEEQYARGRREGRHVQEGQRLHGYDVSDYLAYALLWRDTYQELLTSGTSDDVNHTLALSIAYINGVLSCFD